MPKNVIDYSNTIIYKIYCNDNAVKEVYIGHTTNFSQRKCCHKNTCNNIKSYLYNLKIYQFIREHGGWENWNMVEIAKYDCKDATEARIKEQYHYKLETSTLNSIEPNPDKKIYKCDVCNIIFATLPKLDYHKKTNKHIKKVTFMKMKQSDPNSCAENAAKFECLKCDFKCSKQSEFDRHLVTRKHKILTNTDTGLTEKTPTNFLCECGKMYKHRQSLSFHKNKCQDKEPKDKNGDKNISDKEIIKMLIKENSEFKNMILDVVKTIQPNNTTNNNTTNNNNNHFNLHIYLNETCKNAVNLVDFVESLQVQLKDLEETAKLGYSEGVSNIFINGLNKLDVTMRPIHCSDAKRETLYIKDQNEWIKEDQSKTHLTKAIKTVGKKNIQQIFEWQKKHPDYNDPESRNNDKYLKMLYNVMNGSTDEEQIKNMDKIVKNIAKEVIIDKGI